MTDKEKRELKDGVISIFKRFNILDHTATIGGLRDNILKYINSLQEEPKSEVWHTMDEEPPQDSNICLLWPKDNIITIGKLNGLKDFRSVSKWAYAESILNLKEEPVNENLKEAGKEWLRPQLEKYYEPYGEGKMMELTKFDGYAMLDAIEFGAEWQKKKDAELPKIWPRDTIDEYAYQVAYDLSNDWARDYPEWKDVETACKLGAEWMRKQMMKDAVEAKAVWYDGYHIIFDDENVHEAMPAGVKDGDKLKLIIIKKEEE